MHQKRVLYIGNFLQGKQHNPSYMISLGAKLEEAGFYMRYASSQQNKIFRLLDMIFSMLRYARKLDVVLIDTYSTQNFWYAVVISRLCRWLKVPYITLLHGGNLPERLRKNPRISKSLFNNGYINVSPSEFIKRKFEEFGFSNLLHIPNAIDLGNYPLHKKTAEPVKLLWVRSLSEIYNPKMAVKTLLHLSDRGILAELCMVGPDKDFLKSELEEFIDNHQLKVRFTGKLTKEQWINLANEYNFFINTSNFDNMPVSIIEAMALGLPVISTDVGGIPFLIEHGKNGMLVAKNDAAKMAESIIYIMSNPSVYHNLSTEARRTSERFDWTHVLPIWLKFLNDMPAR